MAMPSLCILITAGMSMRCIEAGSQSVVLFASVPLTAELWQLLDEGTFVIVQDGFAVAPRARMPLTKVDGAVAQGHSRRDRVGPVSRVAQ
jgi:hypothetical protein